MNYTANARETDDNLTRILCERLKWDKRVSLSDLFLTVSGGVVQIKGYVDTAYKKYAAIEVISQTEGVWSIDDQIVVPGDYLRSDEEIDSILKKQLKEVVMIAGEHIEVIVHDGVVRLVGEVLRPRLKALAVANAWELSGVKDVRNLIEIKYPPQHSPRYVSNLTFNTLEEYQKEVS